MRLCIVDVETTGLDHSADEITEVGGIAYDVGVGVVASFATLVRSVKPPYFAVGDTSGVSLPSRDVAVGALVRFANGADYMVAHSADFDRGFLPELVDRQWICTRTMIDWPKPAKDTSLVQVAVAHSVPIIRAHRALDDCQLIAGLFDVCRADLPAMLADALLPRVKVMALVGYSERGKAKEAGFEWDGDAKVWWRMVRRDRLTALPFGYREIV